jgi:hypothetical protein
MTSTTIDRVRALVEPVVSDLGLEIYDLEQRGGTLRVMIDTPPGSESGVSLDTIAVVTRLVSRELDHEDPLPGNTPWRSPARVSNVLFVPRTISPAKSASASPFDSLIHRLSNVELRGCSPHVTGARSCLIPTQDH